MKLRPWVKIIIFLLIIGIGGYFIYNKVQTFKKDKNTDKQVSALLKENNIPDSKYSKTLEYVLNNGIYDDLYLDLYSDIEYSDKENFKDVLITFLPKGYKGKEVNYIMNLSEKNIEKLKNTDYKDISNYYTFKNFNVDNLDRYNEYHKNHDYSYEQVVTYVNIKLDLPVYTDTVETSDPDSLLVLVNKYNSLPNNYKPKDITTTQGYYGTVSLREVAKEALVELQKAVTKEIGIELIPTTAFRDQGFQATLYNNYVNADGKEKADTYSARPGYSEHQTGLAIDLKNPKLTNIRLTDSDYKWLEENAHKYGFIIRFPKGKEYITCYQFENWHIRYVGKDIAKIIYDNDLTLEEYIDLYETSY